jgi:ribosomal protein S18 acetylase RimI-like enzyme
MGLGAQLDRFAVDFLCRAGHRAARLCVSPTNLPAVAFFRKHQWRDMGPRADHPEVHYMEKQWVTCDSRQGIVNAQKSGDAH